MLRRSITLIRPLASSKTSVPRPFSTTNRLLKDDKKKNEDEDEIDNEPYEYSTSDAAKWKAEYTNHPKTDAPDIQGPIVAVSLSVFMLYFALIREENDIDERLYQPLEVTLTGLQKPE
ncbi:uncharacterized protein LOC100906756 [Galendromus occidentalis]|uniref:Uncharacterized protein LOC100906756 n=1 Tax=Galendromus occidentalis TaxID=34638 RepID=A0AAJ6W094_9ACAR|nr:uncharacterized protein LOC100906756 [Galendromus occidentalis]